MAISASPDAKKSLVEGIGLDRYESGVKVTHLYVLKSGKVTRNSDILKALKLDTRQAEKLSKQGHGAGMVRGNYAVAAGRTSTTFEDGIYRPSSAEFWSEILRLPEDEAIDTALAMAAVAGRFVTSDTSIHIDALAALVEAYICDPAHPGRVDWEFINARNMRRREVWKDDDKARHERAVTALRATGCEAAAAVAEAGTTPDDNAVRVSDKAADEADEDLD